MASRVSAGVWIGLGVGAVGLGAVGYFVYRQRQRANGQLPPGTESLTRTLAFEGTDDGGMTAATSRGCEIYDRRPVPVGQLAPEALRHQDIWNDRVMTDPGWMERMRTIVLGQLDRLNAPADPNLQSRILRVVVQRRLPAISAASDEAHFLQAAARTFEPLTGGC